MISEASTSGDIGVAAAWRDPYLTRFLARMIAPNSARSGSSQFVLTRCRDGSDVPPRDHSRSPGCASSRIDLRSLARSKEVSGSIPERIG